MDISLSQTAETCRCCLKSGNLFSINDHLINDEIEIYKAIALLVPIQITKNDGYSQNICIDCKNQIQQFYNFRQMCLNSDHDLKSNRRPISRNNEHDYSTLIDDYVDMDVDFSAYLNESSVPEEDPEQLLVEVTNNNQVQQQPINESKTELFDDDTQNFAQNIASKKFSKKRYSCPICNKLWISPSKLKRHMASHNRIKEITEELEKEKERFFCVLCGLEFLTKIKLQNHTNIQHLRNIPIFSNGNISSNDIPEKMKTLTDLKKSNEAEYPKCNQCGKTFKTLIQLRRHSKIHTRITKPPPRKPRPRRHECIHCLKKFETPSKLFRHMNVHNNTKIKSETEVSAALEISTCTSILGD